MFNLLTKLFGFDGKEENTNSSDGNDSAEKLRAMKATDSSTTHEAIRPRASSKMGETTIPITNSQTNMKARAYWNHSYYNGHSAQTPQQQLNLLYAPPVGPISRTENDTVWNNHESLGSAKQKALNSYLTKATNEIQSAYTEAEQSEAEQRIEKRNVVPKELTDTGEITLHRSTQEILRDMAHHKSTEVRAHIAANELTPVEALWALSEDESPVVRLKLVSNMNCPIPILELMINDSNVEVARHAADTVRRLWKSRNSAA